MLSVDTPCPRCFKMAVRCPETKWRLLFSIFVGGVSPGPHKELNHYEFPLFGSTAIRNVVSKRRSTGEGSASAARRGSLTNLQLAPTTMYKGVDYSSPSVKQCSSLVVCSLQNLMLHRQAKPGEGGLIKVCDLEEQLTGYKSFIVI